MNIYYLNGGGDAIIELDIRLEVDIMKKKILLLAMLMTLTSLTSCGNNKEITCQDVINVYEDAGYGVFHSELTDQENGGYNCYVVCTAPNSDDTIYFHFFETKEEAEEYSSKGEWNILLYLYSIIAADEPIWVTTKTYNNIAIDYTDYYTYKPFKTLI